jgi:hypothetical protein
VDENFLWDQLRPDHTVPYGPVLWRAPQALGPPQPSTTWSVPNGKRPGKDRPDFWCLNVVCPHPRSPGSVPNRDRPQPGSPTTRRVQPVQHSDKSLSLTAKQTFGIPQQVVCPGSVPNRGGWRKPSPYPQLWGLSPTGITVLYVLYGQFFGGALSQALRARLRSHRPSGTGCVVKRHPH